MLELQLEKRQDMDFVWGGLLNLKVHVGIQVWNLSHLVLVQSHPSWIVVCICTIVFCANINTVLLYVHEDGAFFYHAMQWAIDCFHFMKTMHIWLITLTCTWLVVVCLKACARLSSTCSGLCQQSDWIQSPSIQSPKYSSKVTWFYKWNGEHFQQLFYPAFLSM